MFKWLKYLSLLPQLIGLIRGLLDLVRTAEDFLAGGERGAQKRQLVLGLLDLALTIGDRLGIPEVEGLDRQKVLDVAGTVVDTLVGTLNTLGMFKHAPRRAL
ncbi:MAG: hypothetical protein ACRDH5_04740 [bacterium]